MQAKIKHVIHLASNLFRLFICIKGKRKLSAFLKLKTNN